MLPPQTDISRQIPSMASFTSSQRVMLSTTFTAHENRGLESENAFVLLSQDEATRKNRNNTHSLPSRASVSSLMASPAQPLFTPPRNIRKKRIALPALLAAPPFLPLNHPRAYVYLELGSCIPFISKTEPCNARCFMYT